MNPMNLARFTHDVRNLSYVYTVAVDDDYQSLIIKDFTLPPGYNYNVIALMLKVPQDYPEDPPGVGGSSLFVPESLRYLGRKPKDFHDAGCPRGWAWWCYERIDWDPGTDDLITFFELVRAHLTNPPTRSFL
jgi:hypothetical protein